MCFVQIIESRESNDNSSGENADGAIIVSHLVSHQVGKRYV